jgi:3-dehydrosphinganine reductase
MNMNTYQSYFQNKLVIVTGGSSGIGQAMARQLADAGAHVWIWARRETQLRETMSMLKGDGKHAYQVVDVGERKQVEAALERIRKEAGVPDIVINNAGITCPQYVEKIPIEIFEQINKTNYLGTVYLTQLILPDMLARGSGHIVNVSSTAGFIGAFGFSAYGSTKFAVRGYSDVLRSEMKYRGIRVSILFPPDTDTPMLKAENEYKPFETREISGSTGMLSADAVAKAALQGIARNQYLILPGFNNKLFFWLNNALGGLVYPIMDILLAQALKKKKKI